ncbi:hypothetical protein PT974_03617 [Cladobotryum mycophilum]|uniref:Uncharacterized protein n=1 Tax=Cladobotryum mycophilum TaxID=491253 RepID=A0ABR0SSY1_9HYPO
MYTTDPRDLPKQTETIVDQSTSSPSNPFNSQRSSFYIPSGPTENRDGKSPAQDNLHKGIRHIREYSEDSVGSWSTSQYSTYRRPCEIVTGDGMGSETGKPYDRKPRGLGQDDRWSTAAEINRIFSVPEIGRQDSSIIAREVIQQLRMQTFPNGDAYNIDGTETTGRNSNTFIVTERDIQDIIESSLRKLGQRESIAIGSESRQGDLHRPSRFSLVGLDNQHKGIKPRPSVVLDPATTISVPKTLFSGSGSSGKRKRTKTRGRDLSTTATIISRQSVAEITWTRNGGHIGELSDSNGDSDIIAPSEDSGCTSPRCPSSISSLPPAGYSKQRKPSRNKYSIHDYIVSGNVTYSPFKTKSKEDIFRVSDASSNITSFPTLRNRHCTLEWTKPIVAVGEIDRDVSPDMYDFGVDAHCGVASHRHTLFTEDSLQRRWTTNHSIFDDIPGHSNGDTWHVRRSTLALPSLTRTQSFGNLIRLSSRRRRSVPSLSAKHDAPKEGFLPNIVDKIVKGGQRIIKGSLGRKEPGDAWALEPNASPASSHIAAYNPPPSRDSNPRDRTSRSSEQDRVALLEVMMGGNLINHRRRHTCSEDNRPHVCENDMDGVVRGG